MQRRLALLIVVVGAVLVMGVFVAVAADQPDTEPVLTGNTPPEGAEYVGSDACFQCHSSQYRDWADTIHPYMVQPFSEEALVADFSIGEDVRTFEINGEERVFTVDDITFLMGNKYRQRFIMQTEDTYIVTPIQFNIDAGEWVTATQGDWLESCAGCHTTGYDPMTREWAELGAGCESCHGQGSVHVELANALPEGFEPTSDEVLAVRQAIVASVDSTICGACHNRGSSADGAHGYPVGYVVGGPLDDTMFTSVAPTFDEDPTLDANFWPDGTEKKHRQQYITWSESAHGNALASIQESDHGREYCLPCHSTDFNFQDTTFDEPLTVATSQHSITCVQCHSPHGEVAAEDQLQGESYDLCVQCHNGTSGATRAIRAGASVHHPMREMYEGWSFLGIEGSPSPHYSNQLYGPVCASCHMVGTAKSAEVGDIGSHTWHIVLPTEAAEGQPDSCSGCHSPERSEDNTPENLTFAIESVMEDTQERVEFLREELTAIEEAHPEWADVEAGSESEDQLMAMRLHTMLTFVESDGSWGFHNPGFTDDILSEAEDLLDEMLEMME